MASAQKAVIQLIPLLIIAFALSIVVIGRENIFPKNHTKTSPSPAMVAEEKTPEPTQTISATPTSKATSTPTSAPTPSPQVVTSAPAGTGYSRITIATQRGNFSVSLVSIDMAGARMITDTAFDSDCASNCPTLPLAEYVSRNAGFAGIHGTYFCPAEYSECASKSNSFDFPVYNSRLGKWINAGNLFWNDRSIVYYDGGGMHFLKNANSFGGGLTAGIVNSPGLVEGGNVIADQFPLSDKQKAKGAKAGIGIRGNVVYLVSAGNVDITDLAHIFKSLGASNALNLDGGGSLALWFGGYKVGPGRNIPNAIIFATK